MADVRRLTWRAFGALPGPVQQLARLPLRPRGDRELRALAPMPDAERRLYVGPWNTAGQGWEWARAAERHLPGVAAQNLAARRTTGQHLRYRADHVLSAAGQRGRVRRIHGERVLAQATHVLFESGRPVLANFHAGSMLDDLPALEGAGIRSAVLYHGSEIRDLREHAERYPHSPFRDGWDDYYDTLQSIAEKNRADLAQFGGPVLVSTPDLLDISPRAVWLPVVVDVARFATDQPVLERDRPVVLHAPTNPRLKGGPTVRAQLKELDARGVIEYRTLEGVANAEMPAAIAAADIVLDQFALGATGVFAAEAQAAGRVVVAHVADHVRAAMTDAGGDGADRGAVGNEVDGAVGEEVGGALPVVEASPAGVGQVVQQIVADRDRYRDLAAAGVEWAHRHHDGRRSAQVLEESLLSGR